MADYPARARNPGPMTPEEFRNNVSTLVDNADQFIKEDLTAERERNWRYWSGKSDVPVQKNMPEMVSSDVFDVVEATVSQLAKIFLGGDNIVEFRGEGQLGTAFAREATKKCNEMFRDAAGWTQTVDWIRDNLVSKSGWWKFTRTNEVYSVEEAVLRDISLERYYALIQADVDREILAIEGDTDVGPVSVHTRTSLSKPKYILECLPSEEGLINREAKSADDSWIVGQRTLIHVSDAVAMGVPYETAIELRSNDADDSEVETERQARTQRSTADNRDVTSNDEASWLIKIYDLHVRMDMDGDGFAELRHVVAAGDDVNEIVYNEVVDEGPWVITSPIRIPHAAIGRAQADVIVDISDQSTFTIRQVLQNLAWSNSPRKEVDESAASKNTWKDLLQNKFGGLIRVRRANSIRDMVVPFVAKESMPILQYLRERLRFRTGVSDESLGLNADALQSTNEIGVKAVIGQSQVQVEMIARTLAEDGMVPLFKKMLKSFIENGEFDAFLKATGAPKEALLEFLDMKTVVMVGLAASRKDEKIAALQAIAQKQEMILAKLGMNNPFVTPAQYAVTLQKLVELSPVSGPEEHFNAPQQVMQWKPPQPPPNPEMEKIKADSQAKMAKTQADFQAKTMDTQADAMAKKYDTDINAAVDMQENLTEAQQNEVQMQMDLIQKRHELELEAVLEKYKIDQKVEADTRLRSVN